MLVHSLRDRLNLVLHQLPGKAEIKTRLVTTEVWRCSGLLLRANDIIVQTPIRLSLILKFQQSDLPYLFEVAYVYSTTALFVFPRVLNDTKLIVCRRSSLAKFDIFR